MKAKHVAARIGNASVWSKIFAGILAITLVMLMVPNGLRANAANSVAEQNSNGTTDLQQGEVKTQTEQETLDAFKAKYAESQNLAAVNGEAGWWTLNSDATFVPSSYNAEETAGHFMEQKAQVPLMEYIKYARMAMPKDVNELMDMFSFSSQQAIGGWILGLLAGYEETPTTGNVFEDLSDALIIPDWDSANKDGDSPEFNTFTIMLPNKVGNNYGFAADGSILFLTVTLGDGDNIVDIVTNTSVNATRIVPIIPAQPLHGPRLDADAGLLGSEFSVPENVQAYFSNWSISLDGTNYIPLTWVMDMFSSNSLPIMPYTHYFFKANFWDVEGLVPVHLDFNGAYVNDDPSFAPVSNPTLYERLLADGWYTTDFVNHSVWTKNYFEWTPTWYVYNDIFSKFGDSIWGTEKVDSCCEVFKDEMWASLWREVIPHPEGAVYPGPCWFESDNENYFGTLDKETTLSFSTYAVTPRGHVLHSTNNMFAPPSPYGDCVYDAYVMFYNEWGWPLFQYDHVDYDTPGAFGGELVYFFGDGSHWDYCYDTQIDHAVVYAESNRPGEIYLPLYADIDNFNYTAAGLFDEGLLDFQVERMMFADVNTFMLGDAIDNIQVNYLQDGKQLFDTYTMTDPWQMMMFALPMVTNGTITTWNNTLVSGFGSYLDFVHPFGDVDMLNAFSAENFEASPVNHWYQCQIIVNPKPGYTFNNWTYDFMPFSADVEGAGEDPLIISEPLFMPNHTIGMNISKPAAALDADGTAIYGEAVTPAADAVLASDGAATATNTGTAQTGDFAGFACAILALVALAACITVTRKIMVK